MGSIGRSIGRLGVAVCGVVLAGGLVGAQVSEAATYYVATSGNDANPGTELAPWKTPQKAANTVVAGDTVRLRAGTYGVGSTWAVRRAGTSTSPITYRAYGDGTVLLTNATSISSAWTLVKNQIYQTTTSLSTAGGVFQNDIPLHPPGEHLPVSSVDDLVPNSFWKSGTTLYVWLEDGSNPTDSVMRASPGHVVSLYDCHYSVFEGLTVAYGFNGFKQQGSATHHITYRNNTIRSLRSQGIQPTPPNAVIEGNRFQKIGVNKYTHGIYTSKPGIIIRQNVFEEIAGAAIHVYDGSTLGGGNYQIDGNIFRKPRRMTIPTTGTRYYVDMIIWESGSNLLTNNVLYGDGKRGGISLNSPHNRIYNNTFVNSTTPISFAANQSGNRVFNNIFQNSGTRRFLTWPSTAGAQTLDYNLYFNTSGTPRWQRNGVTYSSFSSYQAAGGESHSLYEDPQLMALDNAHLQAISPAIDLGTPLSNVVTDFDGTSRPQGCAYDIGAFEYYPDSCN